MLKKPIQVNLAEFSKENKIKFGTSGIRGFNFVLTDKACYVYTLAFLQYLEKTTQMQPNQTVILAGDLRENTDHIIQIIYQAILSKGYQPEYCGKIPTPALCYYAMHKQCAGIIVTGSHIPADMNGIKFYKAKGEILKDDEEGIMAQTVVIDENLFTRNQAFKNFKPETISSTKAAFDLYVQRYQDFFPLNFLSGLKIGLYAHSSVAAPVLKEILKNSGAAVTHFGEKQSFYSIDTEALTTADILLAKEHVKKHPFDAIISTDGDGDRPLMSDEEGNWIHGDTLGMLCAIILEANYIVIPISCNSSVEQISLFKKIVKTKIGSPYVIEKMNELIQEGKTKIIGYEANGGVLIGSPFIIEDKLLPALPTRDGIIPMLSILNYVHQQKIKITDLIKKYCCNFTASRSVINFPIEKSRELLTLLNQLENIRDFFQIDTPIKSVDYLDGVRIYFVNDEVIHLRPSGNAPELRCYTESNSENRAQELSDYCSNRLEQWMERKNE